LWNDDLYVVQTRPVTAASETPGPDLTTQEALLQGVGASSGVGAGSVHLVFNVDQAMAIRPGEVLVTPMTNPDMVVAMRTSAAVVTDVGGMICHAAIVSRELGLPCVVGTQSATRSLSEGQIVTVDGGNGRVFDGEVASATSRQPRGTARNLWSGWDVASSNSSSTLPLVSSVEVLRVAPESVRRLALDVDCDLRAGTSGLWNEFHPDSEEFAASVDSYLSEVADVRDDVQVLVTSSNPEWLAVLQAAVAGRNDPGIQLLDPTTETASVVHALAPTTITRHELPPATAAIERMTDPRKVFGHQPEIRRAPMPDPDRRSAWWDRLPEYGRYQREFGPNEDAGEHDWIDVRPEIVITPLLKSLVQPGFEMVPRVLGFNGLPPLQAKWIRGRFHFRGDTFAPLWASLVKATWDRDFMVDLMSRVRLSYDQLAEVSSLFPPDDQLPDLTPQQMTALITSWWPRWVEFFALNQFIQAQGDDVVYPFIDETLAAHGADLEASGHNLSWPAAIDFVAPTTPVMSADFMASIDGVRTALHKAGLSSTAAALSALETGGEHYLAEKLNEHLRDWHWMRDRDLLFEPWDTPQKVIETALNSESHSAIDYKSNLRRNRWATALHVEMAAAAGRSDALHHAIRFLQDLNMERENHHILWLKYSYPLRCLVVEIERRLAPDLSHNDVFFLQAPELLTATAALPDRLSPDLIELVRNRRRAYMHETKFAEVDPSSIAAEDDYY
ncbi:MAG: hypothetical protein KJO18_03840, partial [Acidimicrobiia bacterium]|nr:hypothetical protein [Acidimicrobiia bacterium]